MVKYRFTDKLMQRIDDPPRRSSSGDCREPARATHTHIYLSRDALAGGAGENQPTGGLPPAKRSQTTAPPSAGFGDQGEGEEEGELICRLEPGGDGSMHASSPDGQALAVKRNADGSLEIRHLGTSRDGNPEKLGLVRPPGAAAHDALRKWQRDGGGDVQTEYLANRARAAAIDAHWQARRSRRAG
jgi:hypothetical protein